MEKLAGLLAFRCDPELREKLQQVSKRMGIVESAVARVALREGLRIVGAKGIQPASKKFVVEAGS
jgi:hypothetical protein